MSEVAHEEALASLQEALGPQARVETGEEARFAASFDNARISFLPEAVLHPSDEGEVGKILEVANRFGVPIIGRGGGSSATGSASPLRGGWVMDFSSWGNLHLDTDRGVAYAQPGVRIAELQEAAEEAGWFYPPDPSSRRWATVGGTLACNASGMRGAKYGVTRDYVLALEGFLPTGEFVRWGAPVRKFAAGYNVRDLWIGSEGMLGIITGAFLRLIPKPSERQTMLAAFEDEGAALAAVRSLLRARLIPSILEFLDRQTVACTEEYHQKRALAVADPTYSREDEPTPAILLIEFDGHPAEVAEESEKARGILQPQTRQLLTAPNAEATEQLWQLRRTCSQAMFQMGDGKLNEDVVVPLEAQTSLLAYTEILREETGLPTPTFGHAADGNFHVHLMFHRDNMDERARASAAVEKLMRKVIELGGAISGEHGIGLAKTPFLSLQHGAAEIATMRRLKETLDPRNILNPGKLFERFDIWEHDPVEVRMPWDKH